jgi:hypothetical protein
MLSLRQHSTLSLVSDLAYIKMVCSKSTTDELHHLHIGQGYDLLWTYHGTVPSEEEYLQMIDRSKFFVPDNAIPGLLIAWNRNRRPLPNRH